MGPMGWNRFAWPEVRDSATGARRLEAICHARLGWQALWKLNVFLGPRNALWRGRTTGHLPYSCPQGGSVHSADGLSGDFVWPVYEEREAICGLRRPRALTCFVTFDLHRFAPKDWPRPEVILFSPRMIALSDSKAQYFGRGFIRQRVFFRGERLPVNSSYFAARRSIGPLWVGVDPNNVDLQN